jgi:hypothetical protein
MKTLRVWECLASATGEDLAEAVRKYHLPGFSHWKNHAAFEAAFAPLEKDLRTSLRAEALARQAEIEKMNHGGRKSPPPLFNRSARISNQRKPPPATKVSPVSQPESSDARNAAILPMSSGWPRRPSGVCATICF